MGRERLKWNKKKKTGEKSKHLKEKYVIIIYSIQTLENRGAHAGYLSTLCVIRKPVSY